MNFSGVLVHARPGRQAAVEDRLGSLPGVEVHASGPAGRLVVTVEETAGEVGKALSASGPPDSRTRRLVKLALAIGARSEGATHFHARQALEEGEAADALRQVALLAITTLGFPAAVAGLTWIEDVTEDG